MDDNHSGEVVVRQLANKRHIDKKLLGQDARLTRSTTNLTKCEQDVREMPALRSFGKSPCILGAEMGENEVRRQLGL